MSLEYADYPELVKFLLILASNGDFRSAFMHDCRTRDERHDFLRQHLFNPSLILRELTEYCSTHAHLLDDEFTYFLANIAESKSLSSALSEFSSQQLHSFAQGLLHSSCSLSYGNSFVTEPQQSSNLSTYCDSSIASNVIESVLPDQSNHPLISDETPCSPVCNICGSKSFTSFGRCNRAFAKCCTCHSLERHRALRLALQRLGLLNPDFKGSRRCLHLAPELCTYQYLYDVYGTGYLIADPCPELYSGISCLKLTFPNDFLGFPSEFFDLIIHNHVMEHLPGSYQDHIHHFQRLLSPEGYMVFTFPDLFYRFGLRSIEGGESFSSDLERLRLFGQHDHFKWLGTDFVSYLYSTFSSVELFCDPRTPDGFSQMRSHNAVGIVFACRK